MGTQPTVEITELAASKFKEAISVEGKDPEKEALRVFVQGGGCSGFQYGLMVSEETNEGDEVIQTKGITIVIDPISKRYLMGARIDFADNATGGGFIVKNPNAKSTCGCGSSFEPNS